MTDEHVRIDLIEHFRCLTRDSRPMGPGICPIMAAGLVRSNADATTLAPTVVKVIDSYTRRFAGWQAWHLLTAEDVVLALGDDW